MSSQQSMFVDPEHQDSEQRIQNSDPREQEGYGEGSPSDGGEAYYQGQYNQGKIQPQRTKKPRLFPFIALLLVVILFIFGGFSFFMMHMGRYEQSSSSNQQKMSEALLAQETIVIRGNASNVYVHTISGNDVLVSTTGKNNAATIRHEAGDMVISVNDENALLAPDLDVMIPQNGEALQIQDSSGNVVLENVTGSVQVTTSSGEIHAQNLDGSASLLSDSGDITIEGINGKAQISTSSGDIDVSKANLSGLSLMTSNSGSVTYHGELSAGLPYQFSTSSDDVNLNLERDKLLKVDAQTSSGDIHNEFGTGTGNIEIHTSSGDITVRQDS